MPRHFSEAEAHLRNRDQVFAGLIDTAGPCTLRLRRDRFDTLVRSILSQQLSTAAARTIRTRLVDRIGVPRPDSLLSLADEDFRSCGVSIQKASYLRDLASRVSCGDLPLNRIGRLSDEDVIERLTAVKGVGRWTAQMFLIFSLGRPDVLPHDDLGIKSAIRRLYDLAELPARSDIDRIAEPWRPHASIACWYLWKSTEPTFGNGNTSATAAATTPARRRRPRK